MILTLWMGATVAAMFGMGYHFYNAVIHGSISFLEDYAFLTIGSAGFVTLPFIADYIIECWRRE